MLVALWIAAIALMLLGLAGIVLPVIPGTPLVFGGIVVLAAAYDFERISVPLLIVLGVVSVILIAVDAVASALGTKRFGGTWRGAVGAAIGALLGVSLGPVGLLGGALAGAVLGESLGGKDRDAAMKAGAGAMLGLLAGAAVKLVACLSMIASALLAHFVWNG